MLNESLSCRTGPCHVERVPVMLNEVKHLQKERSFAGAQDDKGGAQDDKKRNQLPDLQKRNKLPHLQKRNNAPKELIR